MYFLLVVFYFYLYCLQRLCFIVLYLPVTELYAFSNTSGYTSTVTRLLGVVPACRNQPAPTARAHLSTCEHHQQKGGRYIPLGHLCWPSSTPLSRQFIRVFSGRSFTFSCCFVEHPIFSAWIHQSVSLNSNTCNTTFVFCR